MKTRFIGRRIDYDGTQIRSHWAYREFGIQGDSILAFRGACEVPPAHMVDLEDLRAESRIAGPDMLHFVAEHFDTDLEKAVLRQRLLAAIVQAELGGRVTREGDDLYVGRGKLSISIATVTPVSTKIHFAVNVRRAPGVGVETRGLENLKVSPKELASRVLGRYAAEMDGVLDARTRARGVP
jgi:hypothetical protein